MTIATRQVTVTTSAGIELTSGTAAAAGAKYDISIYNGDATNPIYLGASTGVTSSTGYKLAAGYAISFRLEAGERLYARATGSSVTAFAIESTF